MNHPSSSFLSASILIALLATAGGARAYRVGPAVSLEQLTAEADLIFKGTAVASRPVADEWFKPVQGFVAHETEFTVHSVLKGEATGDTVRFRHYDQTQPPEGRSFEPQYYDFQAGQTYIVFAKQAGPPGVVRQLWLNHKIRPDQGVVRCADDKLVTAKTVTQALWHELTALLRSASLSNVTYAISQLDQMSGAGNRHDSTPDFARRDVLAVVHERLADRDARIAQAAIRVVGSHNPYLSDERTVFWLATVGDGDLPGFSQMNATMKNPGGELYRKELVAIADSAAPVETRALAILALGLVREPALRSAIDRWLADPAPAVRAAAAVVLADFPGAETTRRLTALAEDASPEARAGVARAVGFGRQVELATLLGGLLKDQDEKVRGAAAMSLLSFSPKREAVARVFQENLENAEFAPLFLNALAREQPAKYLDALAEAVEAKAEPPNFWGGRIPAFASWEILFKYLQARPAGEIRSGKLDRYLDALEQVGQYSSSEPRDIYAFYLQRGLTERAKKFRAKANQRATYDLERYFQQVDENPAQYQRE